MGKYGVFFVLAALFATQTCAVKVGQSFVQKIISNLEVLKESAQQQLTETQETYKSNLKSFSAIMEAYTDKSINEAVASLASKTCASGTELALRGVKLAVSGEFIGCINFTKSIANLETLGYDLFLFAVGLENATARFLSSVSTCYSYSFFAAASCVVNTIQTYAANFTEVTSEFNVFINRTETLTSNMVSEFKACLFGSQTNATNAISTILTQNCQS